MQQLIENYGSIYFFVLSIVIARYIFLNWKKNKVEAKFIGSGGRALMNLLVSIMATRLYFYEVSVKAIVAFIVVLGIMFLLQYFDGYQYVIDMENSEEIRDIISRVKKEPRIHEALEKNKFYDVLLKDGNGITGNYKIVIKTGLDTAMANEIKLSIAEELCNIDHRRFNIKAYTVLGLITLVVGIVLMVN